MAISKSDGFQQTVAAPRFYNGYFTNKAARMAANLLRHVEWDYTDDDTGAKWSIKPLALCFLADGTTQATQHGTWGTLDAHWVAVFQPVTSGDGTKFFNDKGEYQLPSIPNPLIGVGLSSVPAGYNTVMACNIAGVNTILANRTQVATGGGVNLQNTRLFGRGAKLVVTDNSTLALYSNSLLNGGRGLLDNVVVVYDTNSTGAITVDVGSQLPATPFNAFQLANCQVLVPISMLNGSALLLENTHVSTINPASSGSTATVYLLGTSSVDTVGAGIALVSLNPKLGKGLRQRTNGTWEATAPDYVTEQYVTYDPNNVLAFGRNTLYTVTGYTRLELLNTANPDQLNTITGITNAGTGPVTVFITKADGSATDLLTLQPGEYARWKWLATGWELKERSSLNAPGGIPIPSAELRAALIAAAYDDLGFITDASAADLPAGSVLGQRFKDPNPGTYSSGPNQGANIAAIYSYDILADTGLPKWHQLGL